MARFSGGHHATGDAKGGKLELLAPINQKLAWIHFPEHPGAKLTVEPEGGDTAEYLVGDDSEDGDSVADDSDAEKDSDDREEEDAAGEEEESDEEPAGAGGEEAGA